MTVPNVDVNVVAFDGYYALQTAAEWGHRDIAELLTALSSIGINAVTRHKDTALHCASYQSGDSAEH